MEAPRAPDGTLDLMAVGLLVFFVALIGIVVALLILPVAF